MNRALLAALLLGLCAGVAVAQTRDILSGIENIALGALIYQFRNDGRKRNFGGNTPLTFAIWTFPGWLPQEDRFGRPVLDLSYKRNYWIRSPYDSQQWVRASEARSHLAPRLALFRVFASNDLTLLHLFFAS
jgi:hypothetical protein